MTLRTQLDTLASRLASEIMATVRDASLQELAGSGGRGDGNGRTPRVATGSSQADLEVLEKKGMPARLPRCSPAEIAKVLGKIVLLVKTRKDGMRSEEIRSTLGMQAKEMPRILREGIASNKLTSKGNKRATTYFAKV
jgi:hypothetical protein